METVAVFKTMERMVGAVGDKSNPRRALPAPLDSGVSVFIDGKLMRLMFERGELKVMKSNGKHAAKDSGGILRTFEDNLVDCLKNHKDFGTEFELKTSGTEEAKEVVENILSALLPLKEEPVKKTRKPRKVKK